jgi:uncharacterized glyoxalase superfamily protein PhnB
MILPVLSFTSLNKTSVPRKEKFRHAPWNFLSFRFSSFFAIAYTQAKPKEETNPMNVKKITPVLLVNEIEPVLPFWIDRLGFTKTIEVPDGSKLAFVAFQKGSTEVMYQTYASVEQDAPPVMAGAARKGPTYLYLEVDNLDAVLAAMKDVCKVISERTAFYGMREFAVQDPAGHFITFAQPVATPKQ